MSKEVATKQDIKPKYCRVEKCSNGYLVSTGGTGSANKKESWVANSLAEVTKLLAGLFEKGKSP